MFSIGETFFFKTPAIIHILNAKGRDQMILAFILQFCCAAGLPSIPHHVVAKQCLSMAVLKNGLSTGFPEGLSFCFIRYVKSAV